MAGVASRVSVYQLHSCAQSAQSSLVIVVGLSVLQGEGQPNQTEILDVLLTYRRGEEGGEREK